MSDPREPILDEEADLGEIDEAEETGDEAETGDDAGNDEGQPEDGDEEEGQARDVEPAPRRSRAAGRLETVQRQLREEREAGARYREETERRFRSLETTQRHDPAAAARAAAEEAERVRMMDPDQRIAYEVDKARREFGGALAQSEFRAADRADRQEFQASARGNPTRARLAPKVEEVLAQERAGGRNPPREVIYKYLLGEEVEAKLARGSVTQRRQAGRRVAAQTTRPGAGRGDAARGRRTGEDSVEAARERLRNVTL